MGVSGPKKVFSKPEVSHKKVKIDVFALDIAFKLSLWVHITPLTDFAPKYIINKTGSTQRSVKNTYISINYSPWPSRCCCLHTVTFK